MIQCIGNKDKSEFQTKEFPEKLEDEKLMKKFILNRK